MKNREIPIVKEPIKEEADQKQQESRMLWPDALRVLAACAVVLMHTLTGAVDIMNTGAYSRGRQMLVIMDLVTWCVPVFLIISGYLFLNPEKQLSFGRMLCRYCLRIVLALLIFGVPFSCLELILTEKGFRIGMLAEGLFMVLTMKSWSHMWYLYLILLLYLLTPGIKWLLRRLPQRAVFIFMGLLLTGSSILPFWNKVSGAAIPVFPDGTIYLFYYLYGYFLRIRKKKDVRREAVVWGAAAAGALTGMIIYRLGNREQLQMAYNYPPTVLLSAALIHLAGAVQELTAHKKSRSLQAVRRGITKMAEMSFCIYLIHPVFLNFFYKFLHITLPEHFFLPALGALFVAALCLSAAGAWILLRLPPLRKYVL